MRRTVSATTILVVAALVAGIGCARQDHTAHTTFTVEGMHCESCSASIMSTLEKVDGVDSVTADHELGVAEAFYQPTAVDAEALKVEIEKLGYTVTGMKTETLEG
jgi:copper chaperone CopZ